MSQETLRQAFADKATPLVSYGIPYTEACIKHVNQKFTATQVYLIASKTLTTNTSYTSNLQTTLGRKLVGTRVGMTPHTHMSEVLDIVSECRSLHIDCIVTLGGGSLSDAAKVITFALANNATTQAELVKQPHLGKEGFTASDIFGDANVPTVPIICIPTTLSGGEYSTYAGVTDGATGVKVQFCPPVKSPDLIILDGELACATPLDIWLQSGMRAVDHCVESLVSLAFMKEVRSFVYELC